MALKVALKLALLLSTANPAAAAATAHAATPRCVQDDTQARVCHGPGPMRVLSLAPHLTETVAFVGGQAGLVAVDDASDYPNSVTTLAKLPHPHMANVEAILAFKPSLVLVWQSGFAPRTVAQLRHLGVAVFVSEPRSIAQVASTMQRLAVLLGTQAQAAPRIAGWQQAWQHLPAWNRNTQPNTQPKPKTNAQNSEQNSEQSSAKPVPKPSPQAPVKVFYQVWAKPLMSLGGSHVVSDVLARCGASNVLQHSPKLATVLNPEALLPLQPELILSSGPPSSLPSLQAQWAPWQGLPAVRHRHIALIAPDILVRNGPRLLQAAQEVCAAVATVAAARP